MAVARLALAERSAGGRVATAAFADCLPCWRTLWPDHAERAKPRFNMSSLIS